MYKKIVILILIVIAVAAVLFIYNRNENMENVKNQQEDAEKEKEVETKTYDQDAAGDIISYHGDDILYSDIVEEDPGQYLLSDGNNRKDTTLGNLCSLDCCTPGWNTEKIFDKTVDPSKYVKTNLYCRNSLQNSGCMCVTKSQKDHAETRGGNDEYRKVSEQ